MKDTKKYHFKKAGSSIVWYPISILGWSITLFYFITVFWIYFTYWYGVNTLTNEIVDFIVALVFALFIYEFVSISLSESSDGLWTPERK